MLTDNVKKELRSGKFEKTEDGLFVPRERLLINGVFKVSKRGEVEECSPNLVVDEGLDYILNAAIGDASVISTWYIAPFSGDVTVLATWTAADFASAATEWTLYTPATRPEWVSGVVASGGVDSFVSKAEFTSTADTQTVRGAALISSSTKSNTAGTLIAASRFPSDKNLDTGEILDVGYGLQLTAV